jgi:hypothetical protein
MFLKQQQMYWYIVLAKRNNDAIRHVSSKHILRGGDLSTDSSSSDLFRLSSIHLLRPFRLPLRFATPTSKVSSGNKRSWSCTCLRKTPLQIMAPIDQRLAFPDLSNSCLRSNATRGPTRTRVHFLAHTVRRHRRGKTSCLLPLCSRDNRRFRN